MKETKEIGNLPIATSLSSSDYLITDSGKRILDKYVGVRCVFKDLGAGAKWIRIAEFSGPAAGIISVVNSWNYILPRIVLIAFTVPSTLGGAPVYSTVRLITGDTYLFKTARIVYSTHNSPACYLEVYLDNTSETSYYVDMMNYRNVIALCELGSIPEGWTSKEFALTATVGGG